MTKQPQQPPDITSKVVPPPPPPKQYGTSDEGLESLLKERNALVETVRKRDADIARLDGLLEVRNRELDAMRDAAKKGDRSWQECYHDGQREIERLRREIQELRFNRLHGLHAMARRLGVPSKWLKEQAEASSIPCLKAGSKYIFCPKAVEQAVRHRAANGFIGG